MNYYEHHLGDYLRDTAHLSLLEEGVYRRLLDQYYIREQPLPLNVQACCKLARAFTKTEKAAVDSVLREFFDPRELGWHQDRADREIARYKGKQEKARASANARWNTSDGNANASADAMRTHSEGNALQSPDSSNQSKKPRTARGMRIPDDFEPEAEVALSLLPDLDLAAERQRFRDYWVSRSGAGGAKADWPATWRNWIRQCKDSGRYARKSGGDWH